MASKFKKEDKEEKKQRPQAGPAAARKKKKKKERKLPIISTSESWTHDDEGKGKYTLNYARPLKGTGKKENQWKGYDKRHGQGFKTGGRAKLAGGGRPDGGWTS